eukprot:2186741-Pyramimonas_sp.AAC.1
MQRSANQCDIAMRCDCTAVVQCDVQCSAIAVRPGGVQRGGGDGRERGRNPAFPIDCDRLDPNRLGLQRFDVRG